MIVFRAYFLWDFEVWCSVVQCSHPILTKSNKLFEKWILPRGKSMDFLLNQMLKPLLPFSITFSRNISLNCCFWNRFYLCPSAFWPAGRIIHIVWFHQFWSVPSKRGHFHKTSNLFGNVICVRSNGNVSDILSLIFFFFLPVLNLNDSSAHPFIIMLFYNKQTAKMPNNDP